MNLKKIIATIAMLIICISIFAQQDKKDVNSLKKEDILNMQIEELSLYDLDEIMKIMDIAGASTMEELYQMLLNKDVTSASKSEENLFDSSLATTVLTQEEIQSSGATSIEEALKLVPGIIVREKTNGNYDVQIRGGQGMPMNNMLLYSENTTTLVMIDGRPVFNYGMGGILWETLPVSLGELERIEVVRGPSSALYGANAVNGVINLITKSTGAETPLISANVQSGSLNTTIGDFSLRKLFSDKFNAGVSIYLESRGRNSDKIYDFNRDTICSLDEFNDVYGESDWNINGCFYDIKRSKEKLGINGYIEYKPSKDLSFSLKGGYLDANAISTTLGDDKTPYSQRSSYGYYTNLISNIYGLNFQASLNNVIQNFDVNYKGWEQATEQYNISLDYLIKFKKLSIRPGVSYQSVSYDDRDYIDELGDGYFNDRVVLENFSVSARFDYHASEKLRFVAALRDEKYNKPDKWQPSFQFTGSYKFNDNNLIRAVYSRANQSTFLINAFSNFTWDLTQSNSDVDAVHFAGSENPSMMVQDMLEIGYRTRPVKNLLLDIEVFYNKSKDYSALMPDSFVVDYTGATSYPVTLYTSYRDLDVKSKQFGVSISADMVLSEKLLAKAHFTYQKTSLTDFCDLSRDEIAALQYNTLTASSAYYYSSSYQPSEDRDSYYKDMDNEAVPSFWGSLELTYKPAENLDITAQGYYYDNYYMYTQYESDSDRQEVLESRGYLSNTGHVNGKFTLSAKVNYKINNKINVFLNARNLLNNETQEYVFMDKIGGLYLAGFNINL